MRVNPEAPCGAVRAPFFFSDALAAMAGLQPTRFLRLAAMDFARWTLQPRRGTAWLSPPFLGPTEISRTRIDRECRRRVSTRAM
jgi:hypothetical protein